MRYMLCGIRGLLRHGSRLLSTEGSSALAPEFSADRLSGDHDGIVVFRFNRPQTMNALGRNFVSLFMEHLDQVKFDTSCRVLILKSDVPGAFCSGADLKERAQIPPEEVPRIVSVGRRLANEIEAVPCPVIAAIDGVALGGGLEMALAADIRIAATNARIGLTETRLAIIPGAGGTQRLARMIGPAKAKELIFTAQMISGQDAYDLGIANHIVEQNKDGDAAYHRSLSLAAQILPNGPVALRVAKTAINHGLDAGLSTGLIIEQACYAQTIPTKDRMEGLIAFKEKRKPRYTGE